MYNKKELKYYDISPLISSKTAVFPGDIGFHREIQRDYDKHDYQLSSITTTTHIGSHIDAPVHYIKNGLGIDECPLEAFYGICRVITPEIDYKSKTIKKIYPHKIDCTKILIKTNSFNHEKWGDDYISLKPSIINELASNKVQLVGIDTPSIDKPNEKKLKSHLTAYKHNMFILEGILLSHVPDGKYFLVALPLKIKDSDASPVRAVLFNL